MNTKYRIISILCMITILISSFSLTISAAAYKIESPVERGKWEKAEFDTDYAYSFAFVGDTQYITCGDYFLGTEKLNYQYKYIADTAEERKLAHVFVLGDITDLGYRNDANLGAIHYDPPLTGEWEIAQKAIFQLNDAGVPYSLCRGNHDDYMIDDYFNVPKYTDQFKGCGGFYSDSDGKHPTLREQKNPDGYIYWSAKTGYHENSIVNSWKTMEICGTKYLFMTVDYNPTDDVLNWVDQTLARFPDHKAIITTHAYLDASGMTISSEDGNTMFPLGNTGYVLWNTVLKKHANVFMVVSGHVAADDLVMSYNTGENGNRVLQILVDPQGYDAKEIDSKGTIEHGTQDTGLVLYMNFSEDGNIITLNYYSTLLDKFRKGNAYTIRVDGEVDQDGNIDMAGLSEFGQETPLITEKKTPTLDGVISDGEYSSTKVVSGENIGSGKIDGDLKEYFAYDDEYLYYAFEGAVPTSTEHRMTLHFGTSLYTPEELNGDLHTKSVTFKFRNKSCLQETTNSSHFKLKNNFDAFCASKYDSETKITQCELKIRRGYLKENNSPDNLLSYTVNFGSGKRSYFAITDDVKEYLASYGVTKNYPWTYNYAYFGTRPVPTPIDKISTTAAETTANVTEAVTTTSAPEGKKGGCGSMLGISTAVLMPIIAVTAYSVKKKERD